MTSSPKGKITVTITIPQEYKKHLRGGVSGIGINGGWLEEIFIYRDWLIGNPKFLLDRAKASNTDPNLLTREHLESLSMFEWVSKPMAWVTGEV